MIVILLVNLFYLSPQSLGCLWTPDRSHQTDALKKIVFCVSYSALLSTTKATIIWIARLASATI